MNLFLEIFLILFGIFELVRFLGILGHFLYRPRAAAILEIGQNVYFLFGVGHGFENSKSIPARFEPLIHICIVCMFGVL